MALDAADARYAKWIGWLDRVQQETHGLWLYRHLWDGLVEITQPAHLPPSVIFDAFGS